RAFVLGKLGETNDLSRTSHLRGYAAIGGADALAAALRRSLGDGYLDVTSELCDLILERGRNGQLADAGEEGNELLRALNQGLRHSDRAVRYAAARVMVGLGGRLHGSAQAEIKNALNETD